MKCPKCNTVNPSDSMHCKECGTQLIFADDAQPFFTKTLEIPKEELTTGSTFAGRYQIIEELGRGGMVRVYRVEKFLDLWKDADPGIAEMVDARERGTVLRK